ncbi:MAG: PEP-CTERM sorting domain-containing protein [Armatimonadota bacterium]|nr:PEP-CTERM sorting domain-containing protein [Armatimonadota bacterium]
MHWKGMTRFCVLALLSAFMVNAFATYTIVHRRTFNLNATFPGAEAIGDVAFDGQNVYVSSWHNGSGQQTVRLVQVGSIATLLNTPSGALTPSGWTATTTAFAAARDTRLVYYDGHLYWGAGLGQASTNPLDTGIRRVSTTGTTDSSWSGGVLLPNELDPAPTPQRFDTIDIDPRGPALGVGVFGSSIIRRHDLTTGAAIVPAPSAIGNLPTNGVNTRDIAFRPDGGVYVRYNSASGTGAAGIYFAPRNADGTFGPATSVVTWNEGALQQAFVAYIPVNEVFYSGFSSLVLYNQRISGQNFVFIHNVGNGAPIAITQLDGTEPVLDGDNPRTFQNTFLNASWGLWNGRLFIFVVNGFTGVGSDTGYTGTISFDRLDIYEVVPEPSSMLALGAGAALMGLLRRRKR